MIGSVVQVRSKQMWLARAKNWGTGQEEKDDEWLLVGNGLQELRHLCSCTDLLIWQNGFIRPHRWWVWMVWPIWPSPNSDSSTKKFFNWRSHFRLETALRLDLLRKWLSKGQVTNHEKSTHVPSNLQFSWKIQSKIPSVSMDWFQGNSAGKPGKYFLVQGRNHGLL